MKKIKKVIILVVSAILLIAVSIYGTYIYLFHNNKYYDLIKYEEKLLDTNIQNYIEDVDGYIILDGAEYAVTKMKVKKAAKKI